jgi:hypothetical protein
LNLDLLAFGHAGVFVEFDGAAVDLAVHRPGHVQASDSSVSSLVLGRFRFGLASSSLPRRTQIR